ncbi:MAG: sulfatase-like hydrolase/transferase [Planctomycetota bacterium]|nr:sulfatase-like hydrolase/transferase [Planctomycetota bacterium]
MLALFLSSGCGEGSKDGVVAPGAPRPNVLVLSLDTTRADRLGCYGHAAAHTPNLDGIAARGARFERAYAPVPLTLPTHTTLWTGLQPPEHGIHDNGRNALGPDVPHAAEILHKAGWSTGAFVSAAVLDSAFGLARGFEVYDDRMSVVDAEGDAEPPQRIGDATTDAAIEWLRGAREPFLAWVHYYDPHSTYEPPEPWKSRLKSPYDGEIAFMDDQIGRLLAVLKARGALENTIVVAVADHGESLGEHGEATHGLFVYDATMRIPLIVSAPGLAPRTPGTPVEMADVAPTILELCGLPLVGSGRSLVPALRGQALAPRPIYGESEYGWLAFGWSPLRTLLMDGWRYIHSSDPELYDHARDPGEQTDLRRSEPERAAKLDRELAAVRTGFTPRANSSAKVDEELQSRLSSLGYAQSSAASGEMPDDLAAPRAMLQVHDDFSRGVGFAQHGQPERAIPLLQRAVQAWPRGAQMHQQLGMALQMANRHAEAIAALERALQLDKTLDQAHYFLGLAHSAAGDQEAAVLDFDRAMALRPEGYLPLAAKAWSLVRLQREEEAVAALRQVIAKKPRHASYALSLAKLLRNLGRGAESVAVLSEAHAARPEEQGLTLFLAWELATNPADDARDGKRAVQLAEAVIASRGRSNPDDLDTLAAAYAESGRFDEALATLDEALRAAGASADPALVAEWAARRALYAEKRPFRDG